MGLLCDDCFLVSHLVQALAVGRSIPAAFVNLINKAVLPRFICISILEHSTVEVSLSTMHRNNDTGESDSFSIGHELAHVPSASHATNICSGSGPALHESQEQSRRPSGTSQADPTITSNTKTAIVICCVTYGAGISTFLSGVVVIAIPTIATDLHLPNNLVLLYVSAWLQFGD